jgi:hypothetical protein
MLRVQVDAASSCIAAYLAGSAGVQLGSTVALLLGRGPLLVASLLGVLKAGAAYLVLDGSNKSHMQMMLEDACVQVRDRVQCTTRTSVVCNSLYLLCTCCCCLALCKVCSSACGESCVPVHVGSHVLQQVWDDVTT